MVLNVADVIRFGPCHWPFWTHHQKFMGWPIMGRRGGAVLVHHGPFW